MRMCIAAVFCVQHAVPTLPGAQSAAPFLFRTRSRSEKNAAVLSSASPNGLASLTTGVFLRSGKMECLPAAGRPSGGAVPIGRPDRLISQSPILPFSLVNSVRKLYNGINGEGTEAVTEKREGGMWIG